MIVDDDVNIVKLLKMLLELDGFVVLPVNRGDEAMAKANQEHPDIFLVDFHLVDMDGSELVARLRASSQFSQSPIIVASGLDVEDEVIKAGATAFLTKPFEPSDLSALITQLLGGA
jgi:DNA-binding response OmpR family regulator